MVIQHGGDDVSCKRSIRKNTTLRTIFAWLKRREKKKIGTKSRHYDGAKKETIQ